MGTVTERKDAASTATVPVETTDASRKRPAGKRFGILVHAVLATIALDADAAAVAAAARIQGRITGASEAEVLAAADAAVAALAHPLLGRARAAERTERETNVMHTLADGTLVEGIVDLAFFEKGAGWTVVDFKTDRELDDRRAAYAAQIETYAEAIRAATGEPAKGVLLSV